MPNGRHPGGRRSKTVKASSARARKPAGVDRGRRAPPRRSRTLPPSLFTSHRVWKTKLATPSLLRYHFFALDFKTTMVEPNASSAPRTANLASSSRRLSTSPDVAKYCSLSSADITTRVAGTAETALRLGGKASLARPSLKHTCREYADSRQTLNIVSKQFLAVFSYMVRSQDFTHANNCTSHGKNVEIICTVLTSGGVSATPARPPARVASTACLPLLALPTDRFSVTGS